MSDYYKSVPKDLIGNLQFRKEMLNRCAKDAKYRAAMTQACREDVLFFFNGFCWLFEPRPKVVNGKKQSHQIPFITWPHQDPAIIEIKKHLGFEDIGVEKARGEGASWFSAMLALHDFIFEPLSTVGLVSRTEAAVDSADDPDSLFWKLDWELEQLPKWMVGEKDAPDGYKRNKDKHVLVNNRNRSTITGYAATGDVASGGRKKWFLMDELAKFPRGPDTEAMASTQHVTNSRLVVSTPKGTDGEYYRLMHEDTSMVKVVLDWKDNPSRNRGLYRLENGKPVPLDPVNNPLDTPEITEKYGSYSPPCQAVIDLFSRLRSKGYKIDGTIRSPWFDHECDRPGATPQAIAQELERDYGGSMTRVFGHEFFKAAEADVRRPLLTGRICYHPETFEPEFETVDGGQIHLWCPLDVKGKPPLHQYVVGADISSGLGGSHTSNSVAHVIDLNTMEQVLEFCVNTIEPSEFAEHCIAIAKWFYDAYLIWEANFGGSFTKRVMALNYQNVYYRTQHWKKSKNKKTKEVGWWTDDRSKDAMLRELGRQVKAGDFRLRSDMLVKECGQYIQVGEKFVHVLNNNTADDSSKGKAHGDRVIAACVALQGAIDRPLSKTAAARDGHHGPPPPGSLAHRNQMHQDSLRRKDDVWDDREVSDLAQTANSR